MLFSSDLDLFPALSKWKLNFNVVGKVTSQYFEVTSIRVHSCTRIIRICLFSE